MNLNEAQKILKENGYETKSKLDKTEKYLLMYLLLKANGYNVTNNISDIFEDNEIDFVYKNKSVSFKNNDFGVPEDEIRFGDDSDKTVVTIWYSNNEDDYKEIFLSLDRLIEEIIKTGKINLD